jgi:D-aminopeptidase
MTAVLILAIQTAVFAQTVQQRPRVRDTGVKIGILPTGTLNSITDVSGVSVGHTSIIKGDNVRTGVTAIVPHSGNLFQEKVPGAVFVGNGFGKLMGSTQVEELGEIETPILLTSTLAVPRTADFLLDYMLGLPGNEQVQSVNPLVAETNDGFLNDIRGRHITREDVFGAIKGASGGKVEEGSVGAGTGTVAFGFKGGIGTASRKLPASLGGYTVGILVQTNFGGVLTVDGAPVGVELGKYYLKDAVGSVAERENQPTGKAVPHPGKENGGAERTTPRLKPDPSFSKEGSQNEKRIAVPDISADGSIIIVIATDAPLDARQLKRMAARAMMGVARTGAAGTNGSGDYAIAFSTAASCRIKLSDGTATPRKTEVLANDAMSPLFLAVIEATEEAILNSLFRATTVTGRDKRTVEALPMEPTLNILRKYGRIKQ